MGVAMCALVMVGMYTCARIRMIACNNERLVIRFPAEAQRRIVIEGVSEPMLCHPHVGLGFGYYAQSTK